MSDRQDPGADALTVGELMSTEVICVEELSTIQDALRMMIAKSIRHLPVCKDGRAIAVLSDRDLRLMITDMLDPKQRRRYFETTGVMQHASSPVITTRPQTSVVEVARMFVESRIGCLPVVDADDKLVGIVTQTDLLKWIGRMAD